MASLLSFSSLKPKASSTASPPAATDSLDLKFGRKGIKFSDSAVELTVRNGSSLKLHIPTGHITSYKPKVYWKEDDSAFEEVLHTLPPSSSSDAASRGGVAVVVDSLSSQTSPKNSTDWIVKDVDSDSIDAVQVATTVAIAYIQRANIYIYTDIHVDAGGAELQPRLS